MFFYPKIKPFVEFCWRDGVISFFKIPGCSIDLHDETQFIYQVCTIMDGSISFQTLKQRVLYLYPKEGKFLEDLLKVLDQEYLIEDSFYNLQNLAKEEQERWSKNTEFFGSYCRSTENKYQKQLLLRESKVTILGLGGVGSNILMNLAALGVLNFKIIDYDQISLSNLNRQVLYSPSDIGYYKSDVAKSKILHFLPQANIEHINKKIQSENDILDAIDGQNFLICAADDPRDQILDWANKACVKLKIPFICGGLDSLWASYFSIIPGKTGCIECWKETASKKHSLYQDIIRTKHFVSASLPNVAIMPLISIVSGLVSSEFLKIITRLSQPQALGRLCVFNFKTAEITVHESWKKLDNCSICGVNYQYKD